MAVKCSKCGGTVPDIMYDGDRCDCKNHNTHVDIDMDKWFGKPQLRNDASFGVNE